MTEQRADMPTTTTDGVAADLAPVPNTPFRVVMVTAALAGAFFGATYSPNWQVAVETAQIVGGIVDYPDGSPMLVIHTRMWTVLHQVCAVLLHLGMSESTLSIGLCGLLGAIIYMALASCSLALSGQIWVALSVPLLVGYSLCYDWGIVYPVMMPNAQHTYGTICIPMMLLIPSLLACGRPLAAAFLLGFFPAVHPVVGIWSGIVAAVAGALCVRSLAPWRQRLMVGFAAGCVVTVVSLIVHYSMMVSAPVVDPAASTRWVQEYVRAWEAHRGRFELLQHGVVLCVSTAASAVVAMWSWRRELRTPQRFLLTYFVVAFGILSVSTAFSWLPVERIPRILLVLMPGRVLNILILANVAVVFGVLARDRDNSIGQVALGIGALALTVYPLLHLFRRVTLPVAEATANIAIGLAVVFVAGQLIYRRKRFLAGARLGRRVADVGVVVAVVFVALYYLAVGSDFRNRWRSNFVGRENDPFWHRVAHGEGVLLTPTDAYLTQLRCRRPTVIDPSSLDNLPYVPQAAPAVSQALHALYGLRVLDPPKHRNGPGVPKLLNRIVWEGFSPEQWQALAETFGFSEILAHHGWNLALPVAAEGERFTLYTLPQR